MGCEESCASGVHKGEGSLSFRRIGGVTLQLRVDGLAVGGSGTTQKYLEAVDLPIPVFRARHFDGL